MVVVSEVYRQRIVDTFGEEGKAWLLRLPELVDALAEHWQLTIQPPFGLSYNYVAPVIRADGSAAVLKLGVPSSTITTEIAALELYAGRGIVQTFAIDRERSAMLLERLQPGIPLRDLAARDDEQATIIAAEVMRQLFRPLPPAHPFPSLEPWLCAIRELRERWDGGTGPLPTYRVQQAEAYRDELLASLGPPVLLHADLHHFNILQAERRPWLAIDPKGVVGEAEYEVGAFLHNPWSDLLHWPAPRAVLARRVDVLAEHVGFDRQRILRWGVVNAVLAACWSAEDGGDGWQFPIACADILASIIERPS
jgi:streptomycin 6-kinase